MKKYELTEETIKINENQTLYRIKALKDFSNVKAGDLGGYVESEKNLSHYGDCWISEYAKVYDDARISGTAIIFGNARIFGSACISGTARISGNVWIYGSARISGNANVF